MDWCGFIWISTDLYRLVEIRTDWKISAWTGMIGLELESSDFWMKHYEWVQITGSGMYQIGSVCISLVRYGLV